MTTSIDQLRNALNGTASKPAVVQIQPVAPPKRTSEEMGQLVGYAIVLAPAVVALQALFLWLAAGTIHDLFPTVPAPGYWQSVTLVLGLHMVALLVKPRAWQWARR